MDFENGFIAHIFMDAPNERTRYVVHPVTLDEDGEYRNVMAMDAEPEQIMCITNDLRELHWYLEDLSSLPSISEVPPARVKSMIRTKKPGELFKLFVTSSVMYPVRPDYSGQSVLEYMNKNIKAMREVWAV